jgi:hypothetical protein
MLFLMNVFLNLSMSKNEFLGLPESDQNAMISKYGKLITNFARGNTTVSLHRLTTLFIRTISNQDGRLHVEVHTAEDLLKLTQTSSDPINLLFAQNPCGLVLPS